jgi:hypothetical protein
MNEKKPFMTVNAQVEGAFMALISVIIGLVTLVPFLSILALAGPVPIMLLVLRRGVKVSFLATLVAGCIFSIVAGLQGGIFFVINFNLVGLVLGLGIKRKWSISKIILSGSLVSFLYIIASLIIVTAIMGQNIDTMVTETFNQVLAMMKSMGWNQDLLGQSMGFTKEEIIKNPDLIKIIMIKSVKATFMAANLLVSLFGILLQYMVAASILKRLGYELPSVPAFSSWRLSWRYAWVFILGFILMTVSVPQVPDTTVSRGTLLINSLSNPWFIIGENIFIICQILYVMIGLSIIYFFLSKFKVPLFVRIFAIMILFGCGANVIMFIGLFDTWFNIRKLEPKSEKEEEKKNEDLKDVKE